MAKVTSLRSTIGLSQRPSLPFLLSHGEVYRGIVARQAGLGHVTVRAHNQAMTVPSLTGG